MFIVWENWENKNDLFLHFVCANISRYIIAKYQEIEKKSYLLFDISHDSIALLVNEL